MGVQAQPGTGGGSSQRFWQLARGVRLKPRQRLGWEVCSGFQLRQLWTLVAPVLGQKSQQEPTAPCSGLAGWRPEQSREPTFDWVLLWAWLLTGCSVLGWLLTVPQAQFPCLRNRDNLATSLHLHCLHPCHLQPDSCGTPRCPASACDLGPTPGYTA